MEVTEQPGRLQAQQALEAGSEGSASHQLWSHSDQAIPLWPVDALVVWPWKTIFVLSQTLERRYAKTETQSETESLAGCRDDQEELATPSAAERQRPLQTSSR